MKRLAVVAAVTAVLALVALPAAAAGSSTHGPVTLEIEVTYQNPDSWGPFTADAVVCPEGDTVDLVAGDIHGVVPPFEGNEGYAHGGTVLMRIEKQFTCTDGTGTFTLLFTGVYHWDQGWNHGEWKVMAGTGDYEDLKGHGTFRVVMGESPNLEVWEGHMFLP